LEVVGNGDRTTKQLPLANETVNDNSQQRSRPAQTLGWQDVGRQDRQLLHRCPHLHTRHVIGELVSQLVPCPKGVRQREQWRLSREKACVFGKETLRVVCWGHRCPFPTSFDSAAPRMSARATVPRNRSFSTTGRRRIIFSIMMEATPSSSLSGATVIGCRIMRRAIGCAARSRPFSMKMREASCIEPPAAATSL